MLPQTKVPIKTVPQLLNQIIAQLRGRRIAGLCCTITISTTTITTTSIPHPTDTAIRTLTLGCHAT